MEKLAKLIAKKIDQIAGREEQGLPVMTDLKELHQLVDEYHTLQREKAERERVLMLAGAETPRQKRRLELIFLMFNSVEQDALKSAAIWQFFPAEEEQPAPGFKI